MRRQGKYYWHNKKITLMFALARLFGKTYVSCDLSIDADVNCRLIMKYFFGKYYVIEEETK